MPEPTLYHGLTLPDDGQIPWGDEIRENFRIIDRKLSLVQGTMYALDNIQSTVISAQNVAVKANVPNTAGVSPCDCVTFSANRITYSGADRVLAVVSCFLLDPQSNNQVFRMSVAQNGVVLPHTSIDIPCPGADNKNGTLTGLVEVSDGDYLELWIANRTSTADVVVADMILSVKE